VISTAHPSRARSSALLRRILSVATSKMRRSQLPRSHRLPATVQSLPTPMPLLLAIPLPMPTPARTTISLLTTPRASTTLVPRTASIHSMLTAVPQATHPAALPLPMLLVVLLVRPSTHSMVSGHTGATLLSRQPTTLQLRLRLRLEVRKTVLRRQPPPDIHPILSPLWSLSRRAGL